MNKYKGTLATFIILTSILACIGLYQNFSLFSRTHHLSAYPNVCSAGNATKCYVEVSWSVTSGTTACLFRQSDRSRLGCGLADRLLISTDLEGDVLELKSGTNYNSTVVDRIRVIAIQTSTNVLGTSYDKTYQVTEPLVDGRYSFTGGTWDGKVFFDTQTVTVPSGAKRSYIVAKAMRPNMFANKSPEDVDFLSAFSGPYLLNADPLTPEEQAVFKSKLQGKVLGLQNVDINTGNFYEKDHVSLSADPAYLDNPYASDITGARRSNGAYLTYRFQLYMNPTKMIVDGVTIRPRAYSEMLGVAKGYLIVQNSDTSNAQVVAGALEPMVPVRDINGNNIDGQEATLTLDGRLMVWDGLPTIIRNGRSYKIEGYNNFLMYAYRQDPANLGGWSVPRPLSEMYYVDGPGAGERETRINGIKFSAYFPLAKYPIRDDLGRLFTKDRPIFGSYPWISPDGADLVYSTIMSFSGNQRNGSVLLGERTQGKIRHVDGGLNPFRGGTPSGAIISENSDEGRALASAYSKMNLPMFNNRAIGSHAYWNIAFTHLVVSPGSWDGLNRVRKSGFPYSYSEEAYGFLIGRSGRYTEVPLPKVNDDVLLWLPMNESISFSREAVDNYIMNPSRATRELVSSYRTDRTPDLSIYHNTAKMNEKAQFPYEYNEVPKKWEKEGVLLDRTEGASGNSVFLSSGGRVDVTLFSRTLKVLNQAKRFHLSFWFRPSSNRQTPLLTWDKVISLSLDSQGRLELNHTLKSTQTTSTKMLTSFKPPVNKWTHVLVSRDLDRVRLYIDGQYFDATFLAANSFPNWEDLSHRSLIVGPSALSKLDVDEVRIGTGYLENRDIHELARIKANHREWSDVAKDLPKGRYFTEQGLLARIPQNNPYSRNGALIGQKIFNEADLSANRRVSCATCHIESAGFADRKRLSQGISGFTLRNSPSLVNLAFRDSFFWDGSAPTLESQVLHPFIHPTEMGLSPSELVARIEANSNLKKSMTSTYGSVTPTTVAKALASYVRSLTTPQFAFDPDKLNAQELRGWKLFNGRANCIACHSGPLFSDDKLHDVGLAAVRFTNGIMDQGAFLFRRENRSQFAIKTPSLINVRDTAPYFHDGRAANLEDVVEFYNKGGDENTLSRTGRSPLIHALGLNRSEADALVAFLKSLSAPINKL